MGEIEKSVRNPKLIRTHAPRSSWAFYFFGEVGCAESAFREFVSQKTQGDELEGLRVHSVMGKRGAE